VFENPYLKNPYLTSPTLASGLSTGLYFDENSTRNLIETYKSRPRAYNRAQIDLMKKHATAYNIPFAEEEQSWADYVSGITGQLLSGYVSGLTTLQVGGVPQTGYEGVARAIGSIAGFTSFVPSAPFKLLGMPKLAAAAMAARGKASIPLMVANKAMKGLAKAAPYAAQLASTSKATSAALKLLSSPAISHFAQRGARLGIASAVSSWQGGVDDMLKSFGHGALGGIADGMVGSYIKFKDTPVGEQWLKALAGSLVDGLPSTLRGDTTPEQVYYYLRGAYFGKSEMGWQEHTAAKHHAAFVNGKYPTVEEYVAKNEMPKQALDIFKPLADKHVVNAKIQNALKVAFGDLLPVEVPYKITEKIVETPQKPVQVPQKPIAADKPSEATDYMPTTINPTKKSFEEVVVGTETRRVVNIRRMSEPWAAMKARLQGRPVVEIAEYVGKYRERYGMQDNLTMPADTNTDDSGQSTVNEVVSANRLVVSVVNNYLKDRYITNGVIDQSLKNKAIDEVQTAYNKSIDTAVEMQDDVAYDRSRFFLDFTSSLKSKLRDIYYQEDDVPEALDIAINKIGQNALQTVFRSTMNLVLDKDKLVADVTTPDHQKAADGLRYAKFNSGAANDKWFGSGAMMDVENVILRAGRRRVSVPIVDIFNGNHRALLSVYKSHSKAKTEMFKLQSQAKTFFKEQMNLGNYYYGGVSAKTTGQLVPIHRSIFEKRADSKFINKWFNGFITVAQKTKRFNPEGKSTKELADLVTMKSENSFIHNYTDTDIKASIISNFLYHMEENGYDAGNISKEMVADYFREADTARWALSAKDQTKRAQLTVATGSRLPRGAEYDTPVIKDDHIRMVIVASDKGNIVDLPIGENSSRTEVASDGSTIMPLSFQKAAGRMIGIENVTALKPAGGQSGMYIKTAFHTAPSKVANDTLEKYGVLTARDTAVKISGNRPIMPTEVYADMVAGKLSQEDLDKYVVNVPVEDFVWNAGKKWYPEKVKGRHVLPKQFFTVPNAILVNESSREFVSNAHEELVRYMFDRKNMFDVELTDKMLRYISGEDTPKDIEQEIIDNFDKVPMAAIVKLIEDSSDVAVKNKIISTLFDPQGSKLQEKIKSMLDDDDDGGMERSEAAESRLIDLQQGYSDLQYLMSKIDDKESILLNPGTRRIALGILRNLATKQYTSPKIYNSGEAVLSPTDAEMIKGTKLETLATDNDSFMLDSDFRDMEIRLRGKKVTTLGKLWNAYDKLPFERKQEADEIFDFVLARVPIGAPYGMTTLRFRGFTDMQGGNIYLNPFRFVQLGGADTDFDTIKMFTGSRQTIKEGENTKYDGDGITAAYKLAIRQYNNLAYIDKDGKKYPLDTTEAKDPDGVPYKTLFERKGDIAWRRAPINTFNPFARADIHLANADGRDTLGVIANNITYLNELATLIRENGGKFEYTPKGGDETLVYTLRSEAHLRRSLDMSGVALNMCADVAKFDGLIPAEDMVKLILDNAFIVSAKSTSDPYRATEYDEVIEASKQEVSWARKADNGYEVSTKGDTRFSALNAKLKDGRTIEEAYQLDVKGYRADSNDWQYGKGKPPKDTSIDSYKEYKKLWQQWANENPGLMKELAEKSRGKVLTDKLAKTDTSQARALAEILNESKQAPVQSVKVKDYPMLRTTPATGGNNVNVLRRYDTPNHFGNPFTGTNRGKGTIPVASIDEAVKAYEGWLKDENFEITDANGVAHKNIDPKRRAWILEQIDSGYFNGKTITYYKPKDRYGDYRSHADALAGIINERTRQQAEDTKSVQAETIKTVSKDIGVPIKKIDKESFSKAETQEQKSVRTTAVIESDKTILHNDEIRQLRKQLGITTGNFMPRIASASERSDPAFHVKEIQKAVDSGKYDALYLITKHDGLPMKELLEMKIPKIIHFSITTLGGTKYEPGVMKYNDLLDRIQEYINQGLDPNDITIRVDPLIPRVTSMDDVETVIRRASEMGITRLKVSILDLYQGTDFNMVKSLRDLQYDFRDYMSNGKIQKHANQDAADALGNKFVELSHKYGIKTILSCAESFSNPAISKLGCLDVSDVNSMLGTNIPRDASPTPKQRQKEAEHKCTCFGGKSDLLKYSDKCLSSCVYCYAKHDKDTAMQYYNEDGTLKDSIFTRTKQQPAASKINVKRIISGGQSGGDLGGLLAGKELGLATGGTMPKGFRSEADKRDWKTEYGMEEDASNDYVPRTKKNVDNADATIAFLWGDSVGTRKTIEWARSGQWAFGTAATKYDGRKPVLVIKTRDIDTAVSEIQSFLSRTGAETINIAGHREKSQRGIQEFVKASLVKAIGQAASGQPVNKLVAEDIEPDEGTKYSVIQDMRAIKNAFGGKDAAGRVMGELEFRRVMREYGEIFKGRDGTYLSSLYTHGQDMRWEPKVVNSSNAGHLNQVYSAFFRANRAPAIEGRMRSIESFVADVLRRSSASAMGSKIAHNYINNRMYDEATMIEMIHKGNNDWVMFDEGVILNRLKKDGIIQSFKNVDDLTQIDKYAIAYQYSKQAEMYVLDNLWTMAEVMLVNNLPVKGRAPAIARMAQELKTMSRKSYAERKADESISAQAAKLSIDETYLAMRESLKSKSEKRLFDILLMGPLEYGHREGAKTKSDKTYSFDRERLAIFERYKTGSAVDDERIDYKVQNNSETSPVMLELRSMDKEVINDYNRIVSTLLNAGKLDRDIVDVVKEMITRPKEMMEVVKQAEKRTKAAEQVVKDDAKKVRLVLKNTSIEGIKSTIKVLNKVALIEKNVPVELDSPKTVLSELEKTSISQAVKENAREALGVPYEPVEAPKSDEQYIDQLKVDNMLRDARTRGQIIDRLKNDIVAAEIAEELDKYMPSDFKNVEYDKMKQNPQEFADYEKEYSPAVSKMKDNFLKRGLTDFESINGTIRYILGEGTGGYAGKDMNAITLDDVKVINRYFDHLAAPNKLIDLVTKDADAPIKKAYFYLFPDDIGGEQIKTNLLMIKTPGYWVNKHGALIAGQVLKPTSTIERVADYFYQAESQTTMALDKLKERYELELSPLRHLDKYDEFYDIAIVLREYDALRAGLDMAKIPDENKMEAIKRISDEYAAAKTKLAKISGEMYQIKVKDASGNDVIETVNARQIVDKINKSLTESIREAGKLIDANQDAINNVAKTTAGGQIMYFFKPGTNTLTDVPIIDPKKFHDYVEDYRAKNGVWPQDFGIDGLRKISQSLEISARWGSDFSKLDAKEKAMINTYLTYYKDETTTGKYDAESYFPHRWVDTTELKMHLDKWLVSIDESTLSNQDKFDLKENLMTAYLRRNGAIEDVDTGYDNYLLMTTIANKIEMQEMEKKQFIQFLKGISRSGNQTERILHAGGYARNDWAYREYLKTITKAYYTNMSQRLSRIEIATMRKEMTKTHDANTANKWATFMHLYGQGAAGYSVILPDHVINDPEMNVNGTLYKAYADNLMVDRLNRMYSKLGLQVDIGNMSMDKNVVPKKPIAHITATLENLRKFSSAEGIFEMSTLLMRPKSAIANLLGGSINTAISVGPHWLRSAQSVDLFANVHKEWKTIDDVKKDFVKWGFIENYILSDLEISTNMKKKNYKAFVDAAIKKIQEDPSVKDTTMLEIAKTFGITDVMAQKASWFMRTTERKLRLDSSMAHYLKAIDALSPLASFDEAASAIPYDSPILLEMARRGVKATQFIYSAPYRPMFSNSSVGKIMTRFQMYALNSVKFRNQILNEAAMYDFQPGTEQYKRFQRMAVADLMSFALANAFVYSLFDSNLPQPYEWIQNLADWMFGGKGERERAFFGAYPTAVAPIQLVSPPALRLVGPTVSAILENDYKRLAAYNLVTMAPGGMLAMDIRNALKNPEMAVEKLTGIPQQAIVNQVKKRRHPITGAYLETEK